MATQKNHKPEATFQSGNMKAVVWKNDGKNGPFYSIALSRPYKVGDGQWRNSSTFGSADVEAVHTVTAQAKAWIDKHTAH